MLIENHIHIRHIKLYQFERWLKKFKSGDTNLANEKGRGRPSNFDDQALLATVEEDESLTIRMFAEDFNVTILTLFLVSKSSEKYRNRLDGSPTNSPATRKPNVSEISRANSVPEESRH